MPGKFITFEGLDGAGKSTFIPYARDLLSTRGLRVLVTREPGGTPAGEKIRHLLLDPESVLSARTEALLVFAARQQHLDAVVRPALARGEMVLCDRFTDSTFAYQGGGRGLPYEDLEILEDWVQDGLQPDLTLLFDLDERISLARLRQDRSADRFEREAGEFHRRVRDAYHERARLHPGRIRLVDASRPLDEVKVEVKNCISSIGI